MYVKDRNPPHPGIEVLNFLFFSHIYTYIYTYTIYTTVTLVHPLQFLCV